MTIRSRQFLVQFQQLFDAVLVALVFWGAHAVRETAAYLFPLDVAPIAPFRYYKWLFVVIIPLVPVLLDINGYHQPHLQRRWGKTLWILVKTMTVCALAVIAVMYFFRMSTLSRGVIVLFAVMGCVVFYAKDCLARPLWRWWFKKHATGRLVILIGTAEKNAELRQLIADNPDWHMQVVAEIQPSPSELADLPRRLHEQPVSCVIFNVPQTVFGDVEKAILACETEGVEAWLMADFVRTAIARTTVAELQGKPVLVFRTTPDVSWELLGKRVIDLVGAGLGLLVLGPLVMLPIAIAIKLTSPGPVFFRQRRNGLYGRQFTMYKFRSMVDNAEMLRAELAAFNEVSGPVFKIRDDPRLTPLGRFLRRTSLDELPQLWNILRGEMSFVGPRPPIPSEVEQYDSWHRRRLSMKPGLTCLWQISGRSNVPFEQWMKLDLEYIDRWSLWLDIKILLRTIPVVLRGIGAH